MSQGAWASRGQRRCQHALQEAASSGAASIGAAGGGGILSGGVVT